MQQNTIEYIGCSARIIAAKNKSCLNISGEIVDETKNTLTIKTGSKKKRVLKQGAVFEIHAGNKKIIINGDEITKKPEERIKLR